MGQALSVYLPAWDVELVRREPRAKRRALSGRPRKPLPPPLLLTMEAAKQERVARCCASARAAGVSPGLSVAEARGLCPSAHVLPFDLHHSVHSMKLLAQWGMRFSPDVAVDSFSPGEVLPGPEGLLFNVTGTAHLFGGEQLFLAEVVMRLQRMGFSARAGIAPTVGAAWALSRYGRTALSVVSEGHVEAALASLPIVALRLSARIRQGLQDVGVERIADLLRLPREGLLTRYGAEVLLRLDQAMGRIEERIEPIRWTEPLILRRLFEGATTQVEAVLLAAQEMLTDLAACLLERESGVRALVLELSRINDPPVSREIMLGRPSRDPKHLWSLLRPKVEGMHLGYGVEGVSLTARWIETIRHDQEGIWQQSDDRDDALDELIDTLVNRWGTQRVLAPLPAASHVPELAYRFVPVTSLKEHRKESIAPVPWVDRPSRLLERAEPAEAVALQPDHPPGMLRWRGEEYAILNGIGPERIASSTFQAMETRDYFKVQTAGGRWLWVYRVLKSGKWFVHGLWA